MKLKILKGVCESQLCVQKELKRSVGLINYIMNLFIPFQKSLKKYYINTRVRIKVVPAVKGQKKHGD